MERTITIQLGPGRLHASAMTDRAASDEWVVGAREAASRRTSRHADHLMVFALAIVNECPLLYGVDDNVVTIRTEQHAGWCHHIVYHGQ